MNPEPYLEVSEAADYLRLHAETVRRMAREGTIPAVKFGRSWRFKVSALDEWACKSPTTSNPVLVPRILCVDDDPLVLRMYDLIFANSPYEVLKALSIDEAQVHIDESLPSCILLDLKLGRGQTGVDLMRRNLDILNRVPIILITAYPDSELVHEAIQLTSVTLLVKSLKRDTVLNAVSRLVANPS